MSLGKEKILEKIRWGRELLEEDGKGWRGQVSGSMRKSTLHWDYISQAGTLSSSLCLTILTARFPVDLWSVCLLVLIQGLVSSRFWHSLRGGVVLEKIIYGNIFKSGLVLIVLKKRLLFISGKCWQSGISLLQVQGLRFSEPPGNDKPYAWYKLVYFWFTLSLVLMGEVFVVLGHSKITYHGKSVIKIVRKQWMDCCTFIMSWFCISSQTSAFSVPLNFCWLLILGCGLR